MDKLVAVRPNATVDVVIGGVTFKVGILPQHIQAKWIEIGSKMSNNNYSGKELLDVQREVVQWAVKDHEGLCYEDGEEVPFNTKKVNRGGKNYMVVADDTLDVYYASRITQDLSIKIVNGDSGDEESPK